MLGESGIEAVRVEPIAKRLGVTKGSFYWHFSGRDELLVALLDTWRERATTSIIEAVDRHSDKPELRLRHLLSLSINPRASALGGLIELGIRDWARRDRRAASVQEWVDSQRLAYITRHFLALGCPRSEAEFRSFQLYSYIVGEAVIPGSATVSSRAERVELFARRMLQDLPMDAASGEALQ